MTVITSSVGVILILAICSARPPHPYESNEVLDILRENGVELFELNHEINTQATTSGTPRKFSEKFIQDLKTNTFIGSQTTTMPPNTTTPWTTTTTTTPTEPPTPTPLTTTTTTTPTAPPTTTPWTTTTTPTTPTPSPQPTPHLKLVKKKVITIEDFEAESEL